MPQLDYAAGRILLSVRPLEDRTALRRAVVLVGWAVFVSTIAQTFPRMLPELPLRHLLQEKVGAVKMSSFFLIAMSPWYFKPIAGLLSDAFPLAGTRRRSYLMLGAVVGGVLWLLMGFVPRTFAALVVLATAMNCGLVILSSAVGGLLAERGQSLGATGRLTASRNAVMSACAVLGGALGGWLALRAFALTATINGLLVLSLVPLVWVLLDEPRVALPQSINVLRHAGQQFKRLLASGTMWAAAGMLFLFHLSPGFATPLFEHLTRDLHLSVPFVGTITAISGGAGVVASALYAWLCRRLTLRQSLVIAILCAALGTLPFLALSSRLSAALAFAAWGFGSAAAQVVGLDLAARAAPAGIEAMTYALMASAWNISLNLSDVTGSMLWERLHHRFGWLVAINAGTTLLVLVAVPFLPRAIVAGREGERVI